MSGKGDKRRPMDVQYDLFESNWDRVFRRKEIEDRWAPEVKDAMDHPDHGPQGLPDVHKGDRGPMLREVAYDGMWKHSCTTTMEVFWIGKDEVCDACGAWEEDDVR
jgi:hypothetical protein